MTVKSTCRHSFQYTKIYFGQSDNFSRFDVFGITQNELIELGDCTCSTQSDDMKFVNRHSSKYTRLDFDQSDKFATLKSSFSSPSSAFNRMR